MSKIKIAVVPALAAGLLAAGAATAHASSGSSYDIHYVSPSGQPGASDYSCATAAHTSVNAAVAASGAGDMVVVCDGTYHEQVIIRKPLRLVGQADAVIDAAGQPRLNVGGALPGSIGIGVIGTHDVQVSGLQVEHAGFDGILVASSSYVTLTNNVVVHNGYVGVDINGSSLSHVTRNFSAYNAGGGFLVADDLGRASRNDISSNVASHNSGGGVILAGHGKAGVTANLVARNVVAGNGTARGHSGGGVVIDSAVAGETISGNLVTGNTIYGNGLAGVTIHAHLSGQNLNDNQISGNDIGMNNIPADQAGLSGSPSAKNAAVADNRTTGILVRSASPIRVLISGNRIHDDYYGVVLEGAGAGEYASLHGNLYSFVDEPVVQIGG